MANLLKRLFQVEADLTSNSCDWNLELFEALIANAVFLCDADALLHWNSAAEEGAWGGLKTGPPRRHQIQPVEGPGQTGPPRAQIQPVVQFWTPVQRKRI